MEVALEQHQNHRKFVFEHPAKASSWSTNVVRFISELPEVQVADIDMCRVGASVAKGGGLSKKPIRLMPNCEAFLLRRFEDARCLGD
eukprot:570859-Pyramimonas_sp.AAC.1